MCDPGETSWGSMTPDQAPNESHSNLNLTCCISDTLEEPLLSFGTLDAARPGSYTAKSAARTSSLGTLRWPAVSVLQCHLIAGKHAKSQHIFSSAGASAARRAPG